MREYKRLFFLSFLMTLLILFIFFIKTHFQPVFGDTSISSKKPFIVVIDAGHGGFDSGKVGVDGTLEKDVNLSIALKLKQLLEPSGVSVVMTRTEDSGLYEENSTNKKRQDMEHRALLMNAANADCIVSIHQNSYTEESIDGAQVFFYTASNEGKTLASLIQKSLIQRIDPTNHRIEKSNGSYYLLKQASYPIVIVECGFLSNKAESKKLVDDTYQQKLAWAIHIGILQYLNGVSI